MDNENSNAIRNNKIVIVSRGCRWNQLIAWRKAFHASEFEHKLVCSLKQGIIVLSRLFVCPNEIANAVLLNSTIVPEVYISLIPLFQAFSKLGRLAAYH